MKVMRAYATRCKGPGPWAHVFVSAEKRRARMAAENADRSFHGCRPHAIETLVSARDLEAGIREAMKRHGCRGRCETCAAATEVIRLLWSLR